MGLVGVLSAILGLLCGELRRFGCDLKRGVSWKESKEVNSYL